MPKRKCQADDCDQNHCPECGGHTEALGACDTCVANSAGEASLALAQRSFNGSYEEMNRVMGY